MAGFHPGEKFASAWSHAHSTVSCRPSGLLPGLPCSRSVAGSACITVCRYSFFQRVIVRMKFYGREGRALHEASPLPLLSYTFFPSFSSFFSKSGCFFRKKQWYFTEYASFERYVIPSPRRRLHDRFPRSSFSAQKGNGASRDRGWPLMFICLWCRAYLAVPVR